MNKYERTILGYEKTLPPMQAGRIADILATPCTYVIDEVRKTMTESEYILHALGSGWKPKEYVGKGKTSYGLTNGKYGAGVTKTGYKFALWLVAERLTTQAAVGERLDVELDQRRQQDEHQYKDWLEEAVRNYGGVGTAEGAKILIQRDIFLDVIGEYADHAKSLLVLIDNIDNPRCRQDLISRLHNGNVASIKTFAKKSITLFSASNMNSMSKI